MAIAKRVNKKRKTEYRYDVKYRDTTGAMCRKTSNWFPTKSAALKAQADFLQSKKPAKIPVLRDIFTDWITHREKTGAVLPATITEQKRIIERRFPDLLELPANKITPLQIRKRFEEPEIMDLATETKNKLKATLSALFAFACKFYGLEKNPVDVIDFYRPTAEEKKKKRDRVCWTPAQFAAFCSHLNPDEDYLPLFQFIYWLGLRRSEALSLTFDCLDGDILHVWRKWEPGQKAFRDELKTDGSERRIRLPLALMDVYAAQWDKYKDLPGFAPDWFIFGGREPLTRTTMDRRRKAAIKAAGLPYGTNHAMRHAYVSNMLMIEDNTYLVSRSVGHSNTGTTLTTYAHLPVSDFATEIDKMIDSTKPGLLS